MLKILRLWSVLLLAFCLIACGDSSSATPTDDGSVDAKKNGKDAAADLAPGDADPTKDATGDHALDGLGVPCGTGYCKPTETCGAPCQGTPPDCVPSSDAGVGVCPPGTASGTCTGNPNTGCYQLVCTSACDAA